MSVRLKGQDVSLLLVVNGTVQDTITDIKSFEMTADLEIKDEGYLGEKTNRKDDVFNGISGRMELHYENADVFNLAQSIIERAKRREPGTQINIKASLVFPGGDTKRVIIPDAYFGNIPMNFGSRTDYGTVGLEFKASDWKPI